MRNQDNTLDPPNIHKFDTLHDVLVSSCSHTRSCIVVSLESVVLWSMGLLLLKVQVLGPLVLRVLELEMGSERFQASLGVDV